MKKIIFLSTLLLSVLCLYAQSGSQNSLEYYIEHAIKSSPLINDYKNQQTVSAYEAQRLKAFYTQSKVEANGNLLFVPIISKDNGKTQFQLNPQNATDYYGYNQGVSSGSLQAGLTWTQPLFAGSSYKIAQQQAQVTQDISRNNIHLQTHELQRLVTDQYILCLLDKQRIAFADSLLTILNEQGTRVQAGQPLFRLESKERNALGLDDNNSAGIIDIKATTSGIITLVKQQGGDYVTEGAILCEIANQNSLVFEINVPYEYTQYVAGGKNCTITLPDGKVLNAQIGSPMASMNTASQSQLYKAKANVGFLPEGLIAKVSILKKASVSSSQILPRQAVQCDVSMQKYWIMRLANDSLAVKQEVQVGNGDKSNIEILSPVLSPSERIVLDGSYAMEDSTLVKIIK